MTTKIEWCDETVNPVVGCWPAGPGCEHCYASRLASRGLTTTHSLVAEGGKWNGRVVEQPKQLDRLMFLSNRSQPRRVFVGSMTDLGYAFLLGAFSVLRSTWVAMKAAGKAGHTIIVLTKRPDQLGAWIRQEMAQDGLDEPPQWLWVLVSVWDQESADTFIPHLMNVPAGILGASCEPLLGQIDFRKTPIPHGWRSVNGFQIEKGCLPRWQRYPVRARLSKGLGWVVAGCESGPGRRTARLSWFRKLRDQCASAEVPFFLKQADIRGQLVKMPMLDGRKWSEIPEVDRV